ncbi:MAG: hypothetical protein IJG97_04840 [Bacilli bacterium]|nr:hypothetical protein [Bacilli bacterium]
MMTKKTTPEEKQKKKVKNYIILVFVVLLFVGLVLYLCKWYKVYDEYQKDIPVIRDSLQEIVNEDLEHYILDNPSSLIYICTANDENCRDFEKKFKKLIEKDELADEIIYLNVTGIDQDNFVNSFNEKYTKKKKLTTNYPAIVVFDEGKVVSILQAKKDNKIKIDDVKHFIKLNKVGE